MLPLYPGRPLQPVVGIGVHLHRLQKPHRGDAKRAVQHHPLHGIHPPLAALGEHGEVWGAPLTGGCAVECPGGATWRGHIMAGTTSRATRASASSSSVGEVLRFKVWLMGVSPMIRRRLQVLPTMTLRELYGTL